MRIRKIVSGTQAQPRMTVYRSNKQIYVQFIDDLAGTTLAAASSLDIARNHTISASARSRISSLATSSQQFQSLHTPITARQNSLKVSETARLML